MGNRGEVPLNCLSIFKIYDIKGNITILQRKSNNIVIIINSKKRVTQFQMCNFLTQHISEHIYKTLALILIFSKFFTTLHL